MKENGVDPDDFLADVHDIALDRVQSNELLIRLLPHLPGRRFVFTNGDAPYARRVLERIGISDQFDELHDIHASSYRPKPDPHGYELLCERSGIEPRRALLVDDMVQNLAPAKALGMMTIWVDNGSERGNHNYDEHIVDESISDVGEWLQSILGENQ
jgi:putative hydrolase of the HAD superfamily